MTPHVLMTRRLPEKVISLALTRFEITIREETEPMTEDEAVAALAQYDAILPTLGDAFGAATFARAHAPRARILANFGVGYNHIDVAAAQAAGLHVTNTPGAVTDATADIAMTLVLMAARRAAEGERLVRSGGWTGWHPTQMLGLHVTGKRVGIVGMGRIGRAIARRCHYGFDMEVVFFNRSPLREPGLPARQMESMTEVMSSDIVVIAVPGGAETHHLIDADMLAAMRPHGILVNIARGDVVDESALISALSDGRIGAAGLDVYEREPVVPQALRDLDNVVLLPHLGTAALEVREAMGLMALENLSAFFDGRDLPNSV